MCHGSQRPALGIESVFEIRLHLWILRALVLLGDLPFHRIRRRFDAGSQLCNAWCCNLWLEQEALELNPTQRSLYTAREVIQAVPVYERGRGEAALFLQQNAWVRQFTRLGWESATKRAQRLSPKEPEKSLLVPLLSLLNTVAFRWQQKRMQPGTGHEIIQTDKAFFHPGKRADWVQKRYEKILRSLGIPL